MYDLTALTLGDMADCGAALRRLGEGAGSMEEVAERIVRYLYQVFVDGQGQPATALVRFFITLPYAELEPDLQRHVDRLLGASPADSTLKCQTLLATTGDNPQWRSRHDSRYYKVHPLTAQIVDVNPMFGQVAEMFGFALDKAVTPDPELLFTLEQETYNIFHVADARDNAYVPDQVDFVVPYGIRSVLGFFGMLPSGNLFTVILFAKTPIVREVVTYFRPLTLNVKMAVLPFDVTAVFSDQAEPAPSSAADARQFRSRAASLEQLLDVQERVVVAQSQRLQQLVAELEGQVAENERLRQLAEETAVLEERRRLARDLHDSVSQALYSQSLYAQAAARQLQSGNATRAAEHLLQLQQTAQQALREMRLLIFELRPPALAEEGLVAALRTRLEAVEMRTGMETEVSAPAELSLPTEVETALYWIAQEALNNALKHAQAGRITVVLQPGPGLATLTVRDDGAGFDPAVVPGAGMLGLRGMHERTTKLGWRLVIDSTPGRGTTITVEVPHD